MLKNGYINNTVNKSEKFSDQCYYVCGDGSKVKTGSVDRLQSEMQGQFFAIQQCTDFGVILVKCLMNFSHDKSS